MKKLNKITAALASLALVAAAFTGCVNSYPDLSPLVDLSKATVCGSMNGWIDGETLTANDDGTYYYDFTAKGSQENFCLRGDNKWGVDYRSADGSTLLSEYFMDTEMELVPFNSPDCPPLTGLTTGDNYRITVRPSGSSVFMTITHTGSNSAAFYIFDAIDGLVSVDYDGSKYSYDFTATSTTQDIIFWSEGSYYTTAANVVLKADAVAFDEEESVEDATTTFTGLTAGVSYRVSFSTEDKGKTYKISLAENLIDLSAGDLIGDLDGAGIPFSKATYDENTNSWTFEVKYLSTMTAWGGGPVSGSSIEFKIRKTAGKWEGDYGYSQIVKGSLSTGLDYISSTRLDNGNPSGNPCVTGLENGKTYLFKFTGRPADILLDVSVKE